MKLFFFYRLMTLQRKVMGAIGMTVDGVVGLRHQNH